MKRFLGATVAIALVGAVLTPHGVLAAGKPSASTRGNAGTAPGRAVADAAKLRQVPGEVIVRYAPGVSPAEKAAVRAGARSELVEHLSLPRSEVVKTHPDSVGKTVGALEASPDVLFAEPNYYWHAAGLPNDPRFKANWGLHNTGQLVGGMGGGIGTDDADIDAPEAWDITTGSRNVVVAIADSGVAYDHPDLAANMWINPGESGSARESNGHDDDGNGRKDDWRGWDFIEGDNDPRDLLGHGTHVAGTVGAVGNDGYGTTGVNWKVSLMPLRVLGADGSGTTAHVASAIYYAAANGADVINLSLGGPDYSASVNAAIVASPDLLVVAAAGNEVQNIDVVGSYPCNYAANNIICVAATDQNDNLAGYSNYGAVNVDLAAPGTSILSPVPAFARALRETFESEISSRWIAGGTGTQWTGRIDGSGGFATDSPDGGYQPNSDTWLQTATPVDLSGLSSCNLSYVLKLDTESGADLFSAETSTDGSTWTRVGKAQSGSTGNSWVDRRDSFSAAGSSVFFRFRLTSNALIERDGASIDDVQVRCTASTYTGNEYAFYSGTSMATPHVSGAAALVLSAAPDASLLTVKGALLTGVDAKDTLLAKANTGGRLNVAKALESILPDRVPSTDISPTPTPTPSSSASPTPSPTGSATPAPEPEPTDEVTPEPTPSVEAPVRVDHGRQVSLRLGGHLRLSGQVLVADGFAPCLSSVKVKIKRNGVLVKSIKTNESGTFATKVADRKGRYLAIVPGFEVPEGRCTSAKSPVRRHRH